MMKIGYKLRYKETSIKIAGDDIKDEFLADVVRSQKALAMEKQS